MALASLRPPLVATIVGCVNHIQNSRKEFYRIGFEWRNQWSYARYEDKLSGSEIELVKSTATQEFMKAYEGFNVQIVDGGSATHRIIVAGYDANNVGLTQVFKSFSYVFFDSISQFARKYGTGKDRAEVLRGIGQGVGAVAAHEFGHQLGVVLDNTTHPDSYDFHGGDRLELYYRNLQWSPQALERLHRTANSPILPYF